MYVIQGFTWIHTEMEKISKEELQSAQQYLEWDFVNHRKKGLSGIERNVWTKQKLLEESYIKYKVTEITSKLKDDQAIVGEMQQLLREKFILFLH